MMDSAEGFLVASPLVLLTVSETMHLCLFLRRGVGGRGENNWVT